MKQTIQLLFANYTGVSDTSSTTVSNYSPDSELGISQIFKYFINCSWCFTNILSNCNYNKNKPIIFSKDSIKFESFSIFIFFAYIFFIIFFNTNNVIL